MKKDLDNSQVERIAFAAPRVALGATLLIGGILAANIALASLCVALEGRGR